MDQQSSNFPPINESVDMLLENLDTRLNTETAALITRRDQLILAGGRMPQITDDAIYDKVSDFKEQLSKYLTSATEWKDTAKGPVLKLDRSIMAQHKNLSTMVSDLKTTVEAMQTAWLKAKADKELAERREAERLAQEEAQKALQAAQEAAQKAEDDQGLSQAIAAEEAAQEALKAAADAQTAANVKLTDLTRTTSQHGVTTSLRKKWVHKAVDVDKVDLEMLRPYLTADDLAKAIKKAIAAGRTEIKGVVIEEEYKAR